MSGAYFMECSGCGQPPLRQEKSPGALHTRRFEFCLDHFFGESAGLAASFFAPLPAFTWTSVADMV